MDIEENKKEGNIIKEENKEEKKENEIKIEEKKSPK